MSALFKAIRSVLIALFFIFDHKVSVRTPKKKVTRFCALKLITNSFITFFIFSPISRTSLYQPFLHTALLPIPLRPVMCFTQHLAVLWSGCALRHSRLCRHGLSACGWWDRFAKLFRCAEWDRCFWSRQGFARLQISVVGGAKWSGKDETNVLTV